MTEEMNNNELIGRFDASVAKNIKQQCTNKTRGK